MLLIPDKKKTATMILAKMNPEGVTETVKTNEIDSELAEQATIRRVIAAIEAKDEKRLLAALRDTFLMFEKEEESSEYMQE